MLSSGRRLVDGGLAECLWAVGAREPQHAGARKRECRGGGDDDEHSAAYREFPARPWSLARLLRGDGANAGAQLGGCRGTRRPQLVDQVRRRSVMVSHPLFELGQGPAQSRGHGRGCDPEQASDLLAFEIENDAQYDDLALAGHSRTRLSASSGDKPLTEGPASASRGSAASALLPVCGDGLGPEPVERGRARIARAMREACPGRVEATPLLDRRFERLARRDPRRPPSSSSGTGGSRTRRRGALPRRRRTTESSLRGREARRWSPHARPLYAAAPVRVTSRAPRRRAPPSARVAGRARHGQRGARRGRPCSSSRPRASLELGDVAPRLRDLPFEDLELGRLAPFRFAAGRRPTTELLAGMGPLGWALAAAPSALQVRPTAAVGAELAILEGDDPARHGVEQCAIVRDEQDRSREGLERGLERLGVTRRRGGWSARRARGSSRRTRRAARARAGGARRPRAP